MGIQVDSIGYILSQSVEKFKVSKHHWTDLGPRAATVRFRPGNLRRPRSARPMVRYLETTSPAARYHRDEQRSLAVSDHRRLFFDLSKPISLMKKTHIKNQRVICPDMSCRRREITIEPQGWHSNTFRGSRKQTWEIVKAGGEWPVGWEKIGDSNPKVLLPISGQQLLPRWDWHDMSHVVTQQFTLLILRDGEIQSVQQCEWNPISSTMWGPQDS